MDINEMRETMVATAGAEAPEEAKRRKRKKRKGRKMASVETPTFLATGGTSGSDGFGGMGGMGVLLGALLARGGLLGNEGRRDGEGCVTPANLSAQLAGVTDALQNTTVMQTLGNLQAAVPLAEAQVQLALAGAQSDITSQTMQQTIALQNQGFNAQLANLQGFANTKDAVDSLSTQVAIGQGVTNTAIMSNGWAVTQAINADGEKTRALIQSIDKQNDSRLITAQANEIIELRSERNREADRHGVEITMTNNQNQNQLQFQQQAQVLNTLASALVDVSQVARATNQAINIGSGVQSANPTNSATNVKG